MPEILHPETREPLQICGYAARWNIAASSFRPHAFYIDRDVPMNLGHDFGHFATVGDGALDIWGDAVGLAFCLALTTDTSAALAAYRGGARYCSVQWDCAVEVSGKISSARLIDVCLTDRPADAGAACWVNTDNRYDLHPAARALHSNFYQGRDARDLVDVRALQASAAPSPRGSVARRPGSSGPAAAAVHHRRPAGDRRAANCECDASVCECQIIGGGPKYTRPAHAHEGGDREDILAVCDEIIARNLHRRGPRRRAA